MKIKEQWLCETCHTAYQLKEAAERCEANHKRIRRIEACDYGPYGDKYPSAIAVKMNDGAVIHYHRWRDCRK